MNDGDVCVILEDAVSNCFDLDIPGIFDAIHGRHGVLHDVDEAFREEGKGHHGWRVGPSHDG